MTPRQMKDVAQFTVLALGVAALLAASSWSFAQAAVDNGLHDYQGMDKEFGRYALTQVSFNRHPLLRIRPLVVADVQSEPGNQACGRGSTIGEFEAKVMQPGVFGLPMGHWIVTCNETTPGFDGMDLVGDLVAAIVILSPIAAAFVWFCSRRLRRS